MAITQEQVFAAADALVAAGQKPTLEGIRSRTGGSYTTISPALNAWKARQTAAALPLREAAPQGIADRLTELGTEIWGMALDLVNTRLAAEREALEKTRAEMEISLAEAIDLADQLTAQVEEGQSRLARVTDSEAEARRASEELRQALASAQEEARTAAVRAEERQQQIEGLQERVRDLQKERDLSYQKLSQEVKIQERLERLESRLKG